jgi:actin related protein 2/3 complex subunit 4
VSFLITDAHLESRSSEKVVDFICDFIQAIDAEVSELKLSVNARARALAQEVFKSLAA